MQLYLTNYITSSLRAHTNKIRLSPIKKIQTNLYKKTSNLEDSLNQLEKSRGCLFYKSVHSQHFISRAKKYCEVANSKLKEASLLMRKEKILFHDFRNISKLHFQAETAFFKGEKCFYKAKQSNNFTTSFSYIKISFKIIIIFGLFMLLKTSLNTK